MTLAPSTLPPKVTIVEVGPRDGLQNESASVPTDVKVAFINRLSDAGLPVIEVTAFVSPRWIPAMADADDVAGAIVRAPGVRYAALVPNAKGLARAAEAGLGEVAIFAAATETFSHRNVNQGIDESLATYAGVCAEAQRLGIRVRGYLSTSFGCPFEGAVEPETVATVSRRLLDLGVFEVAVSDTIGVAHPGLVRRVLDRLLATVPTAQVALHFHDTRGTALANVLTALEYDVATFDASAGGLGGCPYAPGATGNLATEDLIYMLDGLGIETGVSLPRLVAASRFMEEHLGRPLPSRYLAATRSSEPS